MRWRNRPSLAVGNSSRGFTLIEVLVALVIVSLGIFAEVNVITQSARTKVSLREKTFAHWVALNVITEWRAKHSLPPASVSGDMHMANDQYHYLMSLSETGFKNLWMLEVSVSRGEGGQVLDTVQGFINQAHLQPNNVTVTWDTVGGSVNYNNAIPTVPGRPVVPGVGDPNSPTDITTTPSDPQNPTAQPATTPPESR